MLSIGKLGAGPTAADYYLRRQAGCEVDYYAGDGERPGVWCGSGARALGLEGPLTERGERTLRALLAGETVDGDRLVAPVLRADPRSRVPAAEGVAVLWALGSPEVSAAVRSAHDAAVSAAVEYMERASAVGLRGHHGRGHRYVPTDGLIGVAFEHRTSREDDPQLHTHVVVANLLHGVDGKWGAVNTREAFRHARTGGFVYQAVLRGELTDRLGVRWGPVRKGQADIDGIPKGLLSLFSKRRAAINAQLDLLGRDDPAAARAATLATRPDKNPTDVTTLREQWPQQA